MAITKKDIKDLISELDGSYSKEEFYMTYIDENGVKRELLTHEKWDDFKKLRTKN